MTLCIEQYIDKKSIYQSRILINNNNITEKINIFKVLFKIFLISEKIF